MSKPIRVGYQGIEGSNSLASAKNMVGRLGWEPVVYVPLVTSQGVVDALLAHEIEYGVMATNNYLAGPVLETVDALKNISYQIVAEDCIQIHHCLFVRDAAVAAIHTVASHIQALKQCAGHLAKEYPDAKWKELEDTAIGARYLHDGTLPVTTGVLCRRDAGESLGLHLLRENLEDDQQNATEFCLIAKKAE